MLQEDHNNTHPWVALIPSGLSAGLDPFFLRSCNMSPTQSSSCCCAHEITHGLGAIETTRLIVQLGYFGYHDVV